MRFFILFAALVLVIPASASAQVMRQVDPKKEQSIVTAKLKLESPAFVNGGEIPLRYTYQGGDVYRGMDISPPLVWSNVPRNTQSFVLIVEDPDAPDPAAPERTWIHWVVYDLPASMKGLPEGIHSFPAGVGQGLNDWGQPGYGGPHPPVGRHRYFFKLYALDVYPLPIMRKPARKTDVEDAMWGHILSETYLMGTYQLKRVGR